MIIQRTLIDEYQKFQSIAAHISRLLETDTVLNAEDLLFFDIETTGLSADSSFLYLIGCMYIEDDRVMLSQFFSEGISEEALLINEFDRLLERHCTLVHFNGQTFDIPYIDKKRKRLGIPIPVPDYRSFDIYKALRSYKNFFGLSSMSQKSLEIYCGLNRKDIYDGGELIEFYNMYIAAKRLETIRSMSSFEAYHAKKDSGLTQIGARSSSELLDSLLLHNFEDVQDMLTVSELLALPDFLKGSYTPASTDRHTVNGCEYLNIKLHPTSPYLHRCIKFSPAFDTSEECCISSAILEDGELVIEIPILTSELKLFYPDYKNYFYLPAEDSAIHKSIGEFLDKSLRAKCTAANCYTRHTLDFIPLAGHLNKNDRPDYMVFRHEVTDRYGFVSLSEITENPFFTDCYIKLLLSNIKL